MDTLTATATHPLAGRPAYSDHARQTLSQLEARLDRVLATVHESEVWRAVASFDTPIPQVLATIREILWSVTQYQPRTTEAGFAMLGQLPKNDEKLLTSLLCHKAEEAGHSEWARRDYLLLGGDRGRLDLPLTPANFAVVAVWQRLAATENPVAYLGAEYLFECLTMQITEQLMPILRQRQVDPSKLGFVVEHATEDVKHTNLIVHWILDVVTQSPESGEDMLRAFDYFAQVYPMPVWNEALRRALPRRD